jgi:hypothetical protein
LTCAASSPVWEFFIIVYHTTLTHVCQYHIVIVYKIGEKPIKTLVNIVMDSAGAL